MEEEKDFCHHCRKYFREYSEATGIHGLRYVIEKRSRVEKIIWAIFLLLSLSGCMYMIYEVLYKYHNSPVVVTFATEDTPLFQIPFPAVTICPEIKYSPQKFNYSQVYHKLKSNKTEEKETIEKFKHLKLVCEGPYDDSLELGVSDTVDGFFDTIDELKPSYKIEYCVFLNDLYPCEKILTPVIIDEGICYSFNILDRKEIFRDNVFQYKNYYHAESESQKYFDSETGYKENATTKTYPKRALMAGSDSSLSLLLQYNDTETDFLCNGMFKGFRVLIHNPWDVPRVSEHYFPLPTGKIVIAAMDPVLMKTSETVRKFAPEKRKCYMKNERPLKYFKSYSQLNCFLECFTNFTLNKCGCVEFYMPRENNTHVCGVDSSDCLEMAERELKTREIEDGIAGRSTCDCQPSCSSLKYNVETSDSNFYVKEYFAAHGEIPREDTNGIGWSLLQIYFKSDHFPTMERNELYGISDLISNLGGLLGLFTGFSLITAAEIIYFCSLRIFYNKRMYGVWSGPPN